MPWKCVITRDGYCTREIKMRIVIAKEAFNRKISSKLNTGQVWYLDYCAVIFAALYGTEKIVVEVFGEFRKGVEGECKE